LEEGPIYLPNGILLIGGKELGPDKLFFLLTWHHSPLTNLQILLLPLIKPLNLLPHFSLRGWHYYPTLKIVFFFGPVTGPLN